VHLDDLLKASLLLNNNRTKASTIILQMNVLHYFITSLQSALISKQSKKFGNGAA
jgi:hypothetical protein